MASINKEFNQYVETLISIFTIDKGNLKILLMRKKTEPYKGYWILPGNLVNNSETLEDNITDAVYDKMGLPSLYIEQAHVYSNINRDPDERIMAVSFIGLIDSVSVELKREVRENIESEWFNVTDIPKIAYDHEEIINKSLDYLKKKLVNTNVLKSLFPSDFTLPELQKIYEQILGIEIDRRNFRKKFINLGLIEDTGYKNEGGNGRPAKLYRFKDNIKETNLF